MAKMQKNEIKLQKTNIIFIRQITIIIKIFCNV